LLKGVLSPSEYDQLEQTQKRQVAEERDNRCIQIDRCVERNQDCTDFELLCKPCLDLPCTKKMNATTVCPCYGELITCLNDTGCLFLIFSGGEDLFKQCDTVTKAYSVDNCSACTPNIAKLPPYKVCKFDSYCERKNVSNSNSTTSTCSPKKEAGSNCSKSDECGDPNRSFFQEGDWECENSTCHHTSFLQIGDGCKADSDCVNNLQNDNVRCGNSICIGADPTEKCDESDECAWGLYCKNRTCAPQIKSGNSCDPEDDEPCEFGYVCSSENKCILHHTKAKGANCFYPNESRDTSECDYDLYCSPAGKCSDPPGPTACFNDSDCLTVGGTCECDGLSGQKTRTCNRPFVVSRTCKEAYDTLVPCLVKNKCRSALSIDTTSCARKYCQVENDCALTCLLDQSDFTKFFSSRCLTRPVIACVPPTESDTSYSKMLTVSYAIVVVLMSLLL